MLKKVLAAAANVLLAVATAAITWLLLLALAGVAALVAGIYLLAGLGWTLVAGGVLLLALAALIMRGMTDG